ncbi:MAG: hypothetical protein ABWK01_06215 [Infirmifilum sp.]
MANSRASLKKRLLELLREDAEFRYAVAGLLGIQGVLDELRKLREDFHRFIEIENRRWEENDKKWAENLRRWEENERRWIENMKRWEENDKKWEENFKRWEENDKKWAENLRRWEVNDKRWEEQANVNKLILNALHEIRVSLGGAYEYYTASWVQAWLEGQGYRCDVKVNVTLPVDGFKEVDVVCFDPLVVAEATVSLKTVEEADREVKKLIANASAAERFTGKKVYAKILAVENTPEEVAHYLERVSKEQGIILILGRKYE